jgi:hypothetical protein
MFSWLRKTALWIVALPVLGFLLGAGMNQAVLVANHDKFPVMWNDAKTAQYAASLDVELKKCLTAQSKLDDPDPDACVEIILAQEGLTYGYLDDTHVLMTKKTHLNFLADWIDLRSATYSLGDLLMDLSDWSMKYSWPIWITVVFGRLRKREDS